MGEEDGDSDGEDLRLESGEPCERIRLEEEGAVIKKLIDPKLPTQEAVDRHWIRGWCEVCVRARGKEWDHAKVKEGERLLPEYSFDYFSQAMSWDTSTEVEDLDGYDHSLKGWYGEVCGG